MTLSGLSLAACAVAVALAGYAYVGYPLLLMFIGAMRRRPTPAAWPDEWPAISITVPAYNEEATIRGKLDRLTCLDYPRDRRQILVVSDASTDRTDAIVREFADRGVELVRLPVRGGKTAAENAARGHLRGEIVVNTDASVRIGPQAMKALIASFADPTVGVASGRDISVAESDDDPNAGESRYVGYEMWIRDLETRVYGIVGASGCFYAIRKPLHMDLVPEALSRDFAAPLIAREHGFRSVSVREAVCFVPRARSLGREYIRKVRTITRGIQTLFYKRPLLNPLRFGVFAWMLYSHKICRWLVPWGMVLAALGLGVLAATEPVARWILGGGGLASALAAVGWLWPKQRRMPMLLAVPTFLAAGNLAALHACVKALRRDLNPIWEPTRREPVDPRRLGQDAPS